MLATILLSYWVISSELQTQRLGDKYVATDSLSAPTYDPEGAGYLVPIFAYYCLLIHFLVFMFPLRSCYAVWSITRTLQKMARNKSLKDFKFGHRRRGSSTSLSSSETLTSSRELGSSSSSEAGDLTDPEYYPADDIAPDRIIHAIVIPNYKEENDTLRETLEVLASHPQARNTYDVSFSRKSQLASSIECGAGNSARLWISGEVHLLTRISDLPWYGTKRAQRGDEGHSPGQRVL